MTLYEPIHDNLSRYCASLCRHEEAAEDLMSDTVLAAFEKFGEDAQVRNFKSYFFGIASNLFRKGLRRNKYQAPFVEESALEIPDHHSNAETLTDFNLLKSLLQKLPSEQREVFVLYEINGFKIAEIAEIQEATVSSIKQRAKRARDTLMRWLDDDLKQEAHQENRNGNTLKITEYEGER